MLDAGGRHLYSAYRPKKKDLGTEASVLYDLTDCLAPLSRLSYVTFVRSNVPRGKTFCAPKRGTDDKEENSSTFNNTSQSHDSIVFEKAIL
jgi:hypothetical protein